MQTESKRELPGGGVIVDRRTPEEIKQTACFVVATDRFMSSWGQAPGSSYFAVPCRSWDDAKIVEANMHGRSEMLRVRIVGKDYRPRLRSGDHLSIRHMADDSCWLQKGRWSAA